MTAPLIDVITPTLWRASRLRGYCDNVFVATSAPCIITFVTEADDQDTLDEVGRLMSNDDRIRLLLNERTKNTTGAFNTAMAHLRTPWWFASGDDVVFGQGWDEHLYPLMDAGYKVIGTNDLGNPDVLAGKTATHFLVDSDYIAEHGGTLLDGPGVAGHEGYRHNFFDTELVLTAKEREVWAPCLAAHVEHRHWVFGKAPVDATYARTQNDETFDRALWAERRLALKVPEL